MCSTKWLMTLVLSTSSFIFENFIYVQFIMSRIYDNKALSALPVDNIEWKGTWTPDSYIHGSGVLIEGTVKSRSKHAVVDPSKKIRYIAIHLAAIRAHRRQFLASGVELEPNFSETEKVI